jgi:hypothetical protein
MEYHREKGFVIQIWCLLIPAANTDIEEGQSRSAEEKFGILRACLLETIVTFTRATIQVQVNENGHSYSCFFF